MTTIPTIVLRRLAVAIMVIRKKTNLLGHTGSERRELFKKRALFQTNEGTGGSRFASLTMTKLGALLSLLALLAPQITAYSIKNGLSQKSVVAQTMAMTTRREPIRMPSQTPMVPYKVRNSSLFVMWIYITVGILSPF